MNRGDIYAPPGTMVEVRFDHRYPDAVMVRFNGRGKWRWVAL